MDISGSQLGILGGNLGRAIAKHINVDAITDKDH